MREKLTARTKIVYFIILKLRLTTFIKANNGDNPAYSVKTRAPGGETSWGRNVQGRTDEGAKRPYMTLTVFCR